MGVGGSGATGGGGTAGTIVVPERFPLRLSADGRRVVDVNGTPFLFQGDAGWGLIAAADEDMVEAYLDDREQKGFNAATVRLIEHHFVQTPPLNIYGDAPFTTPGDFSTPNEAYFAHVDWVLRRADERGILVLLYPAYVGYGGGDEGWSTEMAANGPDKLREFGRYLGKRYKSFPNIVWVNAGNFSPPPDLVRAVALGILDEDPIHLQTAQCERETSAIDCFGNETWLNLNATYTNFNTYDQSLTDYGRAPFKPFFLLEAIYENENESTRPMLRAQAYWAILSGAQGQDFGNNPVWAFAGLPLYAPPHAWDTGLQDPGALDATRVSALFATRPWFDLVPDQNHTTVTAGFGTYTTNPGELANDYVTTARTADGRLVVAYVPVSETASVRTLSVDMSRLSGAANARWYDPTNGAFTTIAGSPLPNSGSRTFTTPGDNGGGSTDWVLVLEVP